VDGVTFSKFNSETASKALPTWRISLYARRTIKEKAFILRMGLKSVTEARRTATGIMPLPNKILSTLVTAQADRLSKKAQGILFIMRTKDLDAF
jgi:hypothetical protein